MISDSLPLAEQAEWDLALCRSVDNILASSHNVLNTVRRASTFTDDENSFVNSCTIIPGVNMTLPPFSLTKSGDNLPPNAASSSVMDTLRSQLGECRDVLRQVDSERRYFRERALIMQRSLDEYEREREQQRMRAARNEDQLRRAQHTAMDAQAKSRRAEAALVATTEKHVHLQRFLRSIPIPPEAAQELAPDRRFEEAFNDKMAVIKYHRRYMCARILFERRAEDAEALRMAAEDTLEAAPDAALPSGGRSNSLSSSGLWQRAPNEASATWAPFAPFAACAGPLVQRDARVIAQLRRRSTGPDGCGAHRRAMDLAQRRATEVEQSRATEVEQSRELELEQRRATELEQRRATELEQRRATELEQRRAVELERKLSEATQSRDAARRCALHTLENLIALHCAYVESMVALRTAAGGGKGFTAVIEEPRDAFAELTLGATDAALDDVRYETRLSEAVQVDIVHAEAVTAAARAVANTKTKTKTRPQQTYQPKKYQQQTQELKIYEQQTKAPKTYEQQTKAPKTYEQQTKAPKTYEQQTQELKIYEQQTQDPKTYEQQTQDPKIYEQQTQELKIYEQQTQELKTYEQQTQDPKIYEQQTQELKIYEQQTQEPQTYQQQTKAVKTYEQQTSETKAHEGCAKGPRKRLAAVAAAEPMPHVRVPLDTRRASSRTLRPMPLGRRVSTIATVTLPQFASSWRG